MSIGNNNTTTVTVQVDGSQAKRMIADIEKQLSDAKAQLDALERSGADAKAIEGQRKRVNALKKSLADMESQTKGVARAMSELDKASPRELERTLKVLTRQFKSAEQGSAAYKELAEKIRAVRQRLADIREELNEQQSLWQRTVSWVKDWQVGIVGALASLGPAVDKMREAVDSYAEMEQEMANVRKYTGMTEEQVAALNEEFKKMDTRSSREQLNQLAQEAGRLGKTSQEDVLGFVRAADQINVALDDLGEGATLTLSKLTGIFGDEAVYGTEQSLLKVGSVINELSQNCSASAPYLAEFASRLGGVGAQAGMTIQQVMGYGAVFDSNAQKVEASATALSQVITRLYQDPSKYAQAAGLDATKFAELVRTDVNSALILLLETLGKAGGMDVLSPMFADMGEKGSRAVAALSTLATHIEEVKAQQQAAAEAFEEGTSITKEFNVQNTTVQASLEKSQKAAAELRVELGQQLYPLMAQVNESITAMATALLTVVRFAIENRTAIAVLAVTIASYTVAVKAATIWQERHNIAIKAQAALQGLLSKAVAGVKIAYYALTGQIGKATTAMKAFNAASKANYIGLIVAAVTAATAALVAFIKKSDEAAQAQKRVAEAATDTQKAIKDERKAIDQLFGQLDATKKGTKEYEAAKKAILDQYGQYLSGLSQEVRSLDNVAAAYRAVTREAENSARARGLSSAKSAADEAYNETRKGAASQLLEGLQSGKYFDVGIDSKRSLSDREVARWARIIADEMEQGQLSGGTIGFLRQLGVYRSKGGFYAGANTDIVGALQSMETARSVRSQEYAAADLAFGSADSDFAGLTLAQLNATLNHLQGLTDKNQHTKLTLNNGKQLDLQTQQDVFDAIADLQDYIDYVVEVGKGSNADSGEGNSQSSQNSQNSQSSHSTTKVKNRFKAEEDWRKQEEAKASIAYSRGIDNYADYTDKMDSIAIAYYTKLLERSDLSDTERLENQSKYWEAANKLNVHGTEELINEENANYQQLIDSEQQTYADRLTAAGNDNKAIETAERTHTEAVELLTLEHLRTLTQYYEEGTDDRLNVERQYREKQIEAQKRHQQEYADNEAKLANVKNKYFGDNADEKSSKYSSELADLTTVYEQELSLAGDNSAERLRIEEAFQAAKKQLTEQYDQEINEGTATSFKDAMLGIGQWLQSDGGQALTGAVSTLVSSMSNIFSGLTTLYQAEADIQTAAVEKRYDKEIQKAQGNTYRVAKLEKQKEEETAKIKAEASRKQYSMQVIQAVAQTAQNALAAYGSAAAIPVIGYILAPIAAAAAVAAGMIQVAAIKKQQQAAEAQGYSTGGFTKKGRVDEPAGIVHAGEWVASQKLLANPVARPMIDALDYAQRTNTVGSLRAEDVSRTITAPTVLAQATEANGSTTAMVALMADNAKAMRSLNARLQEPFVTVNTVTGDTGIKRAQEEYSRLISNKTPKSKRQ